MYLNRLFSFEKLNFIAMVPYHGVYDPRLVAISVLIAILAAFVALSLSDRIAAAPSRNARLAWTSAGALCMGCGIWAMHFIGMLAFSLPCGVAYDPIETMLSMIPGVIASGIALVLISRKGEVDLKRLVAGAVLMGAGIGAMHYMGMAAMRPDALLLYNPTLVVVSVIVAVLLAGAALCIRLILREWGVPQRYATAPSAIIMGAAIAGMHYTAMQAALFYPVQDISRPALSLPSTGTALVIALFIGVITAIALISSFAGRQSEFATAMAAEAWRREKLENEAREGRLRLQAIFDAVADAILTIDRNGLISEWSAGAERMFGYTAEEVIGREFAMLLAARERAPRSGLPRALAAGRASRELAALRKDGGEFPAELTVGEARKGKDVFFTAIMRDVTQRKEAQQEIIRAREAEAEAQAANRMKSEFLANMSHELRTPLNAIIGFADLIRERSFGAIDDKYLEYATDIGDSGRHLLSIINNLLDLSKAEANRLTLQEEVIDIAAVAGATVNLMRELAAEAGVTLDLAVDERLPLFCGDTAMLRQILINLVGNAIKFTPERGKIALGAGHGAEGGLLLTVADTGIGIPANKVELAMAPFGQIESGFARRFGGTGLGLPLTKRLIELHGGKIEIVSEVGTGTTVRASFPVTRFILPGAGAAPHSSVA